MKERHDTDRQTQTNLKQHVTPDTERKVSRGKYLQVSTGQVRHR